VGGARGTRDKAENGMSIGDLAKYLMVSRQNLSGLIGRMERDGHLAIAPDGQDRRSRVVTMTKSGRHVWQALALPQTASGTISMAPHGHSATHMPQPLQ
jgi:DNA-binding MarR family transcriptional regulator